MEDFPEDSMIETERRCRSHGFRNRIMQAAELVEQVFIRIGESLKRLLVVDESVLQDNTDDAALLLNEQIGEAIDFAFEFLDDQRRDIGERVGLKELEKLFLESLVVLRGEGFA